MFKKIAGYVSIIALLVGWASMVQAEDAAADSTEDVTELKDSIRELEKRLMKVERSSALDKIAFSGDFRFEAHSIDATVPDHYDGMELQNSIVNLLYSGTIPSDLTFDQLKQDFNGFMAYYGGLPPGPEKDGIDAALAAAYGNAYSEGGDADNDILYTSRLRLNMHADVADNVKFDGRLGMYKVWGDSTGVQKFNGQPTSIGVDGTTVGVPNSDILRVERAYFTWKDIAGSPVQTNKDGIVEMMVPVGGRTDPSAKIHAFKIHRGRLPVLDEKNWIIPIVVEEFFADGDMDQAVRNAAEEMYGVSDPKYAWQDTIRYMCIFHGVEPGENALQCLECHGVKGRMPWKELGYDADPLTKPVK